MQISSGIVFTSGLSITGGDAPSVTPTVEYLVIAGGFSPNRDGTDDKFIILKPGGTTIKLQIFNRWGNVVYQNNNYQNEWDGRGIGNMLGQDLPAGTYYYSVMAILPGGEMKKFAGPVTLIR